MKLSINAELVYNFAQDSQVIANLEASRTSDQIIVSESLVIEPPAKFLADTRPHGDRSIRASLSGDVRIRYTALVENNLRQLLPPSGLQHVWSGFRVKSCRSCFPAVFVLPTSSCDLHSVSSQAPVTGWPE